MQIEKFARSLSAALRYSMDTHVNLLQQLASPEHAVTRGGGPEADHTFRGVLADALQEKGRDEEGQLLRDPNQHVVVHDGKVKKGRYTDSEIQRRVRQLSDHTDNWSLGEWEPPNVDWANVGGGRHGDLTLADHEQDDLPEDDHIHSPGTVQVTHSSDYEPAYHHFIHISDLGRHLAETIADDVNHADYGWNTEPQDGDQEWWDQHSAGFDRLLHELHHAPYEEPAPESKKK